MGSGSKVSGTANRVTYTDGHVYKIGDKSMYRVADEEHGLNKVNVASITNIAEGM